MVVCSKKGKWCNERKWLKSSVLEKFSLYNTAELCGYSSVWKFSKKHWFSLYSFPKLQFLSILKIHCDVNLIWKQARFVLSYFNKGFKKLYHSYVTLQKWISTYYENPNINIYFFFTFHFLFRTILIFFFCSYFWRVYASEEK